MSSATCGRCSTTPCGCPSPISSVAIVRTHSSGRLAGPPPQRVGRRQQPSEAFYVSVKPVSYWNRRLRGRSLRPIRRAPRR